VRPGWRPHRPGFAAGIRPRRCIRAWPALRVATRRSVVSCASGRPAASRSSCCGPSQSLVSPVSGTCRRMLRGSLAGVGPVGASWAAGWPGGAFRGPGPPRCPRFPLETTAVDRRQAEPNPLQPHLGAGGLPVARRLGVPEVVYEHRELKQSVDVRGVVLGGHRGRIRPAAQPAQSYRRRPCAPAPADRRVQASMGSSAIRARTGAATSRRWPPCRWSGWPARRAARAARTTPAAACPGRRSHRRSTSRPARRR
jgi:hypothetical protein